MEKREHTPPPSIADSSQSSQFDPSRRKTLSGPSFLQHRFRSLTFASSQSSEQASERRGPLGLHLLHAPSQPLIDFIFVHGLKGGSRKTWSLHEDAQYYWPQSWLPLEPKFKNVRIHSFGYNSDWTERKSSNLSVHDFGQALLGEILNSRDICGEDENTAIVLVGHSMGGVVIKKAVLLARRDPNCQKLSRRLQAMFFLATPHRGADSAQLLSKMMSLQSSKAYVEDLRPGSLSAQIINDEFRNAYENIQLWSFFETVKTTLGLIVERESAVMGLPGERVQLLNADHRHVCKFEDPTDSNYCSLRNAFAACIESIEKSWLSTNREEHLSQIRTLSRFLDIGERPESELTRVSQRQVEGTCEWLTTKPSFQEWAGLQSEARVFWMDGEPATGKSTLSGHVIRHLEEANADCAFFFFKHGDSTKSNVAVLLRSLAWQMARLNTAVRDALLSLASQDHFIEKADEGSVWRHVFAANILKLHWRQPCYWVIDAIDECLNYQTLLPFLSKIEKHHPLRIFMTSRPILAFDRLFAQEKLDRITETLSITESLADIKIYLNANAQYLPAEDEIEQTGLLNRILNRSNGNFLWTYLVMQELAEAASVQQAYEILDSVPNGMDGLYMRILESLSRNQRNIEIVKAILKWTVCATRPLVTNELKEAIRLDINVTLPQLEKTIGSITGNLVYVDDDSKVQLTHQTVRVFLLQDNSTGTALDTFGIVRSRDHLAISTVCLGYLKGPELKTLRYRRGASASRATRRSAFVEYAATAFSSHIAKSPAEDISLLTDLHSFFTTNSLTWIEIIASSMDLTPIVQTAKNLKGFLERRRRHHAPLGKAVQDVTSWSKDLSRLVASFGKPLLTSPGSIHFLLPPVCPTTSIIYRQFAKYPRALAVSGLADDDWDDRTSCMIQPGKQVYSIAVQDNLYALGLSDGSSRLYEASTMQEKASVNHKEPVRCVVISNSGAYMATASRKRLSMWNCKSMVLAWQKQIDSVLITMDFNEENTCLMGATRSNSLIRWDMVTGEMIDSFDFADVDERTGMAHQHQRAPLYAAFAPGLNLLAVVYRQRPIVIWDLMGCEYVGQYTKDAERYPGPLCFAMVFNPKPELSLVASAYDDSELVIFDPFDQQTRASVQADVTVLRGSPDGTILAGADANGRISIFEFETLKLLYRINSYDLGIRGLAFTSDGIGLLDIRGDHCNLWEPDVLVRGVQADETSSLPSELSSAVPLTVSTKVYDEDKVITAISVASPADLIFCGREDGTIGSYSVANGELLGEMPGHAKGIAVMLLALSAKGHIVVSVDRSGRIIGRRVGSLTAPESSLSSLLFDKRATDVVRQVLISMDESRLLVSMQGKDQIWDVATGEVLHTLDGQADRKHWKYLASPLDSHRLWLFVDGLLQQYNWALQDEAQEGEVDLGLNEQGKCPIVTVGTTADEAHYFTVLSGSRHGLLNPLFRVWSLHGLKAKSKGRLVPKFKYDSLAGEIKYAIGVYRESFIFLTHQGWVASIKVNGPREEASYSRHFFIPFRYHNNASTLMIGVSQQGNIILTYQTEVVVFQNGLDFHESVSLRNNSVAPRLSMTSTLKRGTSDPT